MGGADQQSSVCSMQNTQGPVFRMDRTLNKFKSVLQIDFSGEGALA